MKPPISILSPPAVATTTDNGMHTAHTAKQQKSRNWIMFIVCEKYDDLAHQAESERKPDAAYADVTLWKAGNTVLID